VQGAEKTGCAEPLQPWAGKGLWWRLVLWLKPTIRVALALEPLPRQPLEALKTHVLQAMNASEFYDTNVEAKRLVQTAGSWSELIAQLADNFYREY
jgi:hypothetical protein